MARNKFSKTEMYDLIREWESSGLSQELFLKEKKMVKSTFGYWRKKYLHDKKATTRPGFIPLHISDSNTTKPDDVIGFIELTYPNGVQLKCSDQVDLSRLKTLIVL